MMACHSQNKSLTWMPRWMYPTLSIVFFVIVVRAQAPCKKTSPYVGFKGALSMLEHNVGGNVEIVDDCTAQVTMARYDGLAPASFWWCATSEKTIKSGRKANGEQLMTALNGFQTVTVVLDSGLTWADCSVFGVWCDLANADFGHVVLKTANGTPAPPPAMPTAMTDSMTNCLELIPGTFNAYWKLDKPTNPTSVTMTLQAVIKDGMWMGFGFSDPKNVDAEMIGSDVVIAGVLNGTAFAVDYFLSARTQCNYAASADVGVCPDVGYSKKAADNNVVLIASSVIMGVVSVTFTKTLNSTSASDHPWAFKDAAPAVFAIGPLSEQSNNNTQIVLYHGATRSDTSFKFNLGVSTNNCPTALATTATNSTNKINSTSMIGRTVFDVTIGTNLNYPNPPAWGLSFHLNGVETPFIKVYRGVMYTFNVMAGPTHPLYITTDITGGNSNAVERIQAGGAMSQGTASAPFVLQWTPNAATPDNLFYQCFEHQKLGWKIQVVDSDDTSACSKTHPYVGFKGMLTQLDHGVAGEVEVLDDCTLTIHKFSYDGQAPAVHVYAAKMDDSKSFKANGVRTGMRIERAYMGEDLMVRLVPGVSWDRYSSIGLWCEQAQALFGSVQLKAVQKEASMGDCSVNTGSGKTTFDSCLALPGSAAQFKVYYSLSKGASGNAVVKGAFSAEVSGWVGLAFAKTPGKMVGSNAIIVRNTPGGYKVDNYYLGAQSLSGVTSPSKLKFMALTTQLQPSQRRLQQATSPVATTFEVELQEMYDVVKMQATPIIYAAGPVTSDGSLRVHTLSTAKSTNIMLGAKGAGGVAKSSSNKAKRTLRLRKTHGILMAVGWGILIPLGIAAAYSFRDFDPMWFYVHVGCQILGFLLGVSGIAIGFYVADNSTRSSVYSHRVIGIIVLALGAAQVLLGVGRPKTTSQYRRGFNILHHWIGRSAAILAIVNIYRGFEIFKDLGTDTDKVKIAYSVVLGAIIAVALLKSWYDYLMLPPPGSEHAAATGKDAGFEKSETATAAAAGGHV